MTMTPQAIHFTKWLKDRESEMDFSEFEGRIVEKFEDEADELDIQGLFVNYFQ